MFFRIIRGGLWLFFKLLALCYIPAYVFRCLQSRKFAPPIKSELLKLPATILVKKIVNKEVRN